MSKTVGNYFHQPISKARRSVLQTQVCKYQGSVVPGSVILDRDPKVSQLGQADEIRSGILSLKSDVGWSGKDFYQFPK